MSKSDMWDEEDCSYLLRQLELSAFSSVVAAMRAQGSINKFKEVLLQSLKQAFFITDEQFKFEMRNVSNDEFLSHVARTLNPSYDTYSGWAVMGNEFCEELEVPQPRFFEDSSTHMAADALLSLASSHNASISDADEALAHLTAVPSLPYVPERLRRLLSDTEQLPEERILPKFIVPVINEKTIVPKTRKRRTRVTAESPVENLSSPSTSGLSEVKAEKTEEVEEQTPSGSKKQEEPRVLTKDEKAAAENQGMQEIISKIQQQIAEESKTSPDFSKKRRKSKPSVPQRVTITYDCARARPFIFDTEVNGVKPPRGNPDKRWGALRKSPSLTGSMIAPSSPQASTSHVPPPSPSPSISGIQQMPKSMIRSAPVVNRDPTLTPVATVRTPTTHFTAVVQKANVSQSSPCVIKRARLSSFTEPISFVAPEQSPSRSASAGLTKPVPGPIISQSIIHNKVKIQSETSVVAYGNPTRTYYGNPSVAALNRTNQPQPHIKVPTLAGPSHVPSVSNVPSSRSLSDPVVHHGHDYGSVASPPVKKRNVPVYKSTTVHRLPNGTVHRSPHHPVVVAPPSTSGQPSSSNVSLPTLLPVVKRLVTPHPQMPVGQFLMRKDSATGPFTAAPPKRLLFCEPGATPIITTHVVPPPPVPTTSVETVDIPLAPIEEPLVQQSFSQPSSSSMEPSSSSTVINVFVAPEPSVSFIIPPTGTSTSEDPPELTPPLPPSSQSHNDGSLTERSAEPDLLQQVMESIK